MRMRLLILTGALLLTVAATAGAQDTSQAGTPVIGSFDFGGRLDQRTTDMNAAAEWGTNRGSLRVRALTGVPAKIPSSTSPSCRPAWSAGPPGVMS